MRKAASVLKIERAKCRREEDSRIQSLFFGNRILIFHSFYKFFRCRFIFGARWSRGNLDFFFFRDYTMEFDRISMIESAFEGSYQKGIWVDLQR